MTNDQIRTIMNHYIADVRSLGIPVVGAILFGSHATGNARRDSDIDVCIISPSFGQDRHSERLTLLSITKPETEMIEPHPYSPVDLANKFDPLANQIRNTGVRIL